METIYLKTLVVAVETGSFSKAANELCITQSAVSQRIKFLEERYGYPLLDRSGPAVVATEAGELVLKKAQSILAIEKELQHELKQFTGKTRLSLCCTPSFGIAYLPGILNSFILENSEIVDLKFVFSTPEQAIRGLQEKDFDIAVIEHCDDIDLTQFETIRLPQDELVFISSPKLGLAAPLVEMEFLLRQLMITRKEGCSSRKLLTLNMETMGKNLADFSKLVVFDDLRLTIQTVVNGGGISFVSTSLISDRLADGSLVAHQVEGFCHNRYRTIAFQRKSTTDSLVASFITCITNEFGRSCLVKG